MNVFAAPGEVFDEIKTSKPSTANWLVPVLCSCLVGVIYVMIIFSQPTVQQQLREQQAKKFEQMVKEGKMKAEDAEQAKAKLEAMGPTLTKIFGSAGAIVASFVWLLLLAGVLKLAGRVLFKAAFPYQKALEAAGLASMITILSAVINMLLVVAMGNMFVTPGPALFVRDFDPANKTHLILSSVNVMTLWYVGVLAIGLARLSAVSFGKAALWLYGLWLVLRAVMIFAGLAASGM